MGFFLAYMKHFGFIIVAMLAVAFLSFWRVEPTAYRASMFMCAALTLATLWIFGDHWRSRQRRERNRAANPPPGEKIKMYAVFAMESVKLMKGSRGKLGTQAGHAYLHASWDSMDRFPEQHAAYRATTHAYKITLVVETVEHLQALYERYREVCGVSLVTDAGFTVFEKPTTTCLGIGPIPESLIDEALSGLKTLQ